MKPLINKLAITQQSWFKTWFDTPYYHNLYQHRNDEEAESFIDYLLNELNPLPQSKILDLGCGSGRHSKYLASKGHLVTGLDLASSSIQKARRWEHKALKFYQHDMRVPFGSNSFDYVFSFFTSFGYFSNKAENNQVVANISNALKEGGCVLFDYINVAYAEKHLVPVEEKEIDGIFYRINRWADHHFIYKRIAVEDGQEVQPLEYLEQVARFTLQDFELFFSKNKLTCVEVFGNYQLDVYDSDSSERLIILAKKVS